MQSSNRNYVIYFYLSVDFTRQVFPNVKTDNYDINFDFEKKIFFFWSIET